MENDGFFVMMAQSVSFICKFENLLLIFSIDQIMQSLQRVHVSFVSLMFFYNFYDLSWLASPTLYGHGENLKKMHEKYIGSKF